MSLVRNGGNIGLYERRFPQRHIVSLARGAWLSNRPYHSLGRCAILQALLEPRREPLSHRRT